jgi:copper homeostasis protein
MVLVEICTDNFEDTASAIHAGCDRIELCSDLANDGLSPSTEFLSQALRLGKIYGVTIFPMVRCRSGNFTYNDSEKTSMIAQAREFVKLGAPGLVCGALTSEFRPDIPFISSVSAAVREINPGVEITFHKAFDLIKLAENESFSDIANSLGPYCDRILTSGGADTAETGAKIIRELASRTDKPLPIAAGRIRATNVLDLVNETGVIEVHSRSPEICGSLSKQAREI